MNDTAWFWGAFGIAIFASLAAHILGSLKKLRARWSEYRCNPVYMPFASLIEPKVGVGENFNSCVNLLGMSVIAFISDVFHSLISVAVDALSEAEGPLDLMRTMMNKLRMFIMGFADQILHKLSAPLGSLSNILLKMEDILRRVVGEGYLSAMVGVSAVSFIESFVQLCITVIKTFVYAMLAISFVLALFQPELLAIVLTIASLLAAAGA
jgi:hypothetical protein